MSCRGLWLIKASMLYSTSYAVVTFWLGHNVRSHLRHIQLTPSPGTKRALIHGGPRCGTHPLAHHLMKNKPQTAQHANALLVCRVYTCKDFLTTGHDNRCNIRILPRCWDRLSNRRSTGFYQFSLTQAMERTGSIMKDEQLRVKSVPWQDMWCSTGGVGVQSIRSTISYFFLIWYTWTTCYVFTLFQLFLQSHSLDWR